MSRFDFAVRPGNLHLHRTADAPQTEVECQIVDLALTSAAFYLAGDDQVSRRDTASCLLFASENAVKVALEAIQTLGGNGYINDYPAGRLLRDAKLYDIGAGTNEIRRMLIGRELFEESVQD